MSIHITLHHITSLYDPHITTRQITSYNDVTVTQPLHPLTATSSHPTPTACLTLSDYLTICLIMTAVIIHTLRYSTCTVHWGYTKEMCGR